MDEKTDFEKTLTFTVEEKKWILEQLNEERRQKQIEKERRETLEAMKKERNKTQAHHSNIDDDVKKQILAKIDEERKEAQKAKEMARKRFYQKNIYTINGREYYRFEGLERIYYILTDDAKKITPTPNEFTIYYQGFEGFRPKKVFIYIKEYADKLFVSEDTQKTYFKEYALEEKR